MSQKIKEFDCVLLKDGREVTVLEVFADGDAFMMEVTDDEGNVIDTPIVERKEVMKVTYRHQG